MTIRPALEALASAALVLHKAGRLEEAEAQYRRILAIDSQHLNALQLLGVLLFDSGSAEKALPLLERAAALVSARTQDQQYSSLYNNLGNALSALGRREEAIGYYHQCLSLRPDDPERSEEDTSELQSH